MSKPSNEELIEQWKTTPAQANSNEWFIEEFIRRLRDAVSEQDRIVRDCYKEMKVQLDAKDAVIRELRGEDSE